MKEILLISVLICSWAQAEMAELDEHELQQATAQAGITLSARFEFGEDTRISYSNADADYLDTQEYWLVIDNLTGGLEMKGMKIDLINDFGPSGTAGAVQVTMPEELIFDDLSTEGIYLGADREVSASHRFIMGMDINGALQFPAATRMNLFAIQ